MVVACQDIYVQIYMCDMRASVYDVHVECAFLSKTYDHCYCTNQYRIPQQKKKERKRIVCCHNACVYRIYTHCTWSRRAVALTYTKKKKNTEILFSIRFMPKSSCDIEREIKLEKPIWITESVEATNSLSMLAFIWHMPMHAMHAVRAQYTKCCTRTTLGKVQWYKWMCSFILTWIVYNWHIESIYSVSVFLQRQ